jgi:signal transduction histidine kinase/CheY-like chemotaxis protein
MLTDQAFTIAFNSSPIGQYLLAPTEDLEILAVNASFLKSVSRRREDVLGLPLFEAFPPDPDTGGDVGVKALASSIRTAIESGEPQLMPVQRYPIKMHKDGRSWFEDMYWSATNTPVYGTDGDLLCISHTTIDITAEMRARQALAASQQEAMRNAQRAESDRSYLSAVLRAAPVGIMVADKNLRILHNNPANEELFGSNMSFQEDHVHLPGWKGWIGEGPDKGKQLAPDEWPLAQALAGHTVEKCLLEVESFTETPVRRTLLVSSAPVIDAHGTVVGAVAVAMDIEERVKAEQALKEADRRKDEFLAMLAHELRNPLAPIGAAAALLSMGDRDETRLRRSSEVITRQVQHMSSLIEELLDVSRVTRGLIKLDRASLDAKHIVAEAIEQARPGIEARRHTLKVNQPPMPAFVNGDRKRLVQVLTNLLNNAAKFTPEGGVIEVELAIDENHVRMSVIDNGIGMDSALIDHAFDLFAQAERTSDRSQGGLGIGLALVRSLVSLHGGNVFARSEGSGRGSRFTVCLPKVDALQAGPDLPHHGAPERAAGGLTVLAVDDNPDALMMFDMLVSSLGHRVFSAPNSREALRHAAEVKPDVYILDIGLPDIDGLALARILRSDPRTSHATLIAVSGYGQEQDRQAAFDAGFDRYYVKPLDIQHLADVLSQLRPAGRQ